jgi:hypothetical protein
MLRNLILIFGIILFAGGIYVASSAGLPGSNTGWTTLRSFQMASNGWDVGLLIVGTCLISSAVIFHWRLKDEESIS